MLNFMLTLFGIFTVLPAFAGVETECTAIRQGLEIEYISKSYRPCVGPCIGAMDPKPKTRVTRKLESEPQEIYETRVVMGVTEQPAYRLQPRTQRYTMTQVQTYPAPAIGQEPATLTLYKKTEEYMGELISPELPEGSIKANCVRTTISGENNL